MLDGRDDAFQFHSLRDVGVQSIGHEIDDMAEDRHPSSRIGGKGALAVPKHEPFVFIGKLQLLVFQHLAELVA